MTRSAGRIVLALAGFVLLASAAGAREKKKEVVYNEQGEIVKTGMNFGPLPAVAYDADKGFQLGAILNLYQYGDGSTYPNYFNRWYFEASYFTKGSMLFQIQHDNKNLIPGVRWSTAASYNIDKAFDFYGFNGFQSCYDYERMDVSNDRKAIKGGAEPDAALYRYNPYYRFNKSILYAKTDFTGHITDNLYWEAGYHFRWYNQDKIDRASINRNKNWYDTFPSGPDTFGNVKEAEMRDVNDVRPYMPTLFELYQDWGLIDKDEIYNANGKPHMFDSSIRLGLMYDTRDKEGAPTGGIWAEGHVTLAPKWLGSSHSYYRYAMTFRHYVPVIANDVLTFAYRISYEGSFGSDVPYYALPFNTTVGNETDDDGFGSYRTTRGVLRTRVVGIDQMLWTAEFRYKFVDFKLWKQNMAFSLTAFTDGSMATRGRDMSFRGEAGSFAGYKAYIEGRYAEVPSKYQERYYKTIDCGPYGEVRSLKEMPHSTFGLGLRFIMNTNFIVAFEYGLPFSRFYKKDSPYYMQDGGGAFYINLGYLF